MYYEAYVNKRTAMKRERSLKRSGKAYHSLKLRILDGLGEGEALD
ncbi:hypothetical protein GCM10011365_25870 [Marinicella pacifica]|uniref:Uncharacterized protein n=1 Tax=Marinicella pacifica TaxID=1171543 RepID=A0A917FV58_9GAMM|nr:hypothetical protein GCM10011365_25870 [Marinicella pacifica]